MADVGAGKEGESDPKGLGERFCRKMAEFWFGPISEADWASWLAECQTWCPVSKSCAPNVPVA